MGRNPTRDPWHPARAKSGCSRHQPKEQQSNCDRTPLSSQARTERCSTGGQPPTSGKRKEGGGFSVAPAPNTRCMRTARKVLLHGLPLGGNLGVASQNKSPTMDKRADANSLCQLGNEPPWGGFSTGCMWLVLGDSWKSSTLLPGIVSSKASTCRIGFSTSKCTMLPVFPFGLKAFWSTTGEGKSAL